MIPCRLAEHRTSNIASRSLARCFVNCEQPPPTDVRHVLNTFIALEVWRGTEKSRIWNATMVPSMFYFINNFPKKSQSYITQWHSSLIPSYIQRKKGTKTLPKRHHFKKQCFSGAPKHSSSPWENGTVFQNGPQGHHFPQNGALFIFDDMLY